VVESDETALLLERGLFDLGLQAVCVDAEMPALALKPATISLYDAGAVVILSGAPDLAGFAGLLLQFSGDECRNPETLVERIRQKVTDRAEPRR